MCAQVRTAGCNAHGQLGLGDRSDRILFTPVPQLHHVVAIQAGDEHSAAVTASGDLFLWGRGDCGQLGLGDCRGYCKPTLLKEYQVVHPGEDPKGGVLGVMRVETMVVGGWRVVHTGDS